MTGLLQELVTAGLIDKLDGDDSRFTKMTQASLKLAAEFRKSRKLLVPAILAGLDTAVSVTDPLIVKANDALVAEWPTVSSVHTDIPVMILRGLLLDACYQAGDTGSNAAILWLIAADTLPFSRLGREEESIRQMLVGFAEKLEKEATSVITLSNKNPSQQIQAPVAPTDVAPEFEIDRAKFSGVIAAALGPTGLNNQPIGPNPNPHWSQSNAHWTTEAAKRLSIAIADQIEALAEDLSGRQDFVEQKLDTYLMQFQSKLQEAMEASIRKGAAEKLRLDTLWWFETLYSPSLRISYRELHPTLAGVVMAMDLLSLCPPITPASLAHILAEAVNRLHGASYNDQVPFLQIINELKVLGKQLPAGWMSAFFKTPTDGRLCLRDTAILALSDEESNAASLLDRASVPVDTEISLPAFAKAIFRQEQALRLTATQKVKA